MRHRAFRIVVITAAMAGSGLAGPASASSSPLIVSGHGITQLHLGASEAVAQKVLERLLGRPTGKIVATPDMKNCGVDAVGSWKALAAYFDHRRLVGLEFGPAHVLAVQTVAGLKLGDPISRARALYAHRFTTSGTNGGAWFVATATGRIDGFLSFDGAKGPTPATKILTIAVGNVGCPAMSP